MRAPLARALSLLLFLALALPASAQSSGSSFALLTLEPSARASALAGAAGALESDDPTATLYNPALLTEAMDGGLSLSYLNHLADVNAGFASYGRRIGGWGTFVASLRYLSYGEFERADEHGVRDGSSFGAGEAALTLSYARELMPNLRGGASIHAAFASIDDAGAQALAADLGVLYSFPSQQIGVSASVHHLGVALSSLGETGDALPFDLRVGVSKALRHIPLTLSVMGYNLDSYDGEGSVLDEALRHVSIGGELRFGEPVRVRVGYNPRVHEALATGERLDLAGVSAGFGLQISRIAFDYAFNSWSQVGGLHQLSVRTRL